MRTRVAGVLNVAALTVAALAGLLTAGTFTALAAARPRPFNIDDVRLAWMVWLCLAAATAGVRSRAPAQDRAARSHTTRVLLTLLLCWALLGLLRPILRAGDGLVGEYFVNTSWTDPPAFSAVDDAPSAAAMLRRWNGAAPPRFSVRWVGFLTVLRTGIYTFAITSADASELRIDNRRVVGDREAHGVFTQSGSVRLERGSHLVELRYGRFGGDVALRWSWSRDGSNLATVPSWALSQRKASQARMVAARVTATAARSAAFFVVLAAVWYVHAGLRDWRRATQRVIRQVVAASYRDGLSLLFSFAVFVLALGVRWPDAQQPFYKAVGRTVRELNVAVLRSIGKFNVFQANLNTPLAGEYVLPFRVQEMLAMLRRHQFDRYEISAAIAANDWVSQQVVASAWPRKRERDAPARFVLRGEGVAADCRLLENGTEVSLVLCP